MTELNLKTLKEIWTKGDTTCDDGSKLPVWCYKNCVPKNVLRSEAIKWEKHLQKQRIEALKMSDYHLASVFTGSIDMLRVFFNLESDLKEMK